MVRLNRLNTGRSGVITLLEELIRLEGRSLVLKVPGRPQVATRQGLIELPYEPLLPEDTLGLIRSLLELAKEELHLVSVQDHRTSFGVEGLGRFRVQISRQRGSMLATVQRVHTTAPSLEEFGLNQELDPLLQQGHGLLLVAGGRIRLGLLAAIIRRYNETVSGFLICIEDPIEYLHRDAMAAISQREVGVDVKDVARGILAATHQNPSALVVDNVEDASVAEQLLRAAEEGMLVVAGVAMAPGTPPSLAFRSRFPVAREEEIAERVAGVLVGELSVVKGQAHWTPR